MQKIIIALAAECFMLLTLSYCYRGPRRCRPSARAVKITQIDMLFSARRHDARCRGRLAYCRLGRPAQGR